MYINATRQQFLRDADGFCYSWFGTNSYFELSCYFCTLERLGYFSIRLSYLVTIMSCTWLLSLTPQPIL